MRKIIIITIVVLFLSVCAACAKNPEPSETKDTAENTSQEAQTPSPEATQEPTEEPTPTPTPRPVYQGSWTKLYGGNLRDVANRAIINSDGDYVLIGNTNSDDGFTADTQKNPADDNWGEPTQDVLILKLDVNGEILAKQAYGGTGVEYATDIAQTPDGSYIICGRSTSADAPFAVNHGNFDMFIMKADADFGLLWITTIGGSGNDEAWDVEVMDDGSFLLAGFTTSRDGDIAEGHSYDNADCLLAKVADDGEIIWIKTFGGTEHDVINRLAKTPDGGWAACGYTNSTDGEFMDAGIHEGTKEVAFEAVQTTDALVVKLSPSGEMEWARCAGGKYDDSAESIALTEDGGYILIGETISKDISGYHSAKDEHGVLITDLMAAKLDANGGTVWIEALGGKRRDTGAAVSAAGGIIHIIGETRSEDGDVIGYHEGRSFMNENLFMPDIWLITLDMQGKVTASGCIGGTSAEYASDILPLEDGGLMFIFSTSSADGDIEALSPSNPGYPDILVFRADPGWAPGQ